MNTPSSREAHRQALAAQVAAFSGSIQVLPGFPERPTYTKRTSWIDPETRSTRKRISRPQAWTLTEARRASTDGARAARDRNMELRKQAPDAELSLSEVARRYGINRSTLQARIRAGLTVEQAITAKPFSVRKAAEEMEGAEIYAQGTKARDCGLPKIAPKGMHRKLRSWWLAGWNDRDMEQNQ